MGAANIVKVVLQLVLLPVMAKLLTPGEFGLYALAVPIVVFAAMLADAGLGVSLARESEASSLVWSTAFWTLLATGALLATGVIACGYALARLTGQPRLFPIIALMSVSLILITVTVPAGARLMRRGWLGVGAAADIAATSTGAVVAIALALHGAGAESLAAQYVVGFAVRACWINAVAFHPPRLEFRLSVLRSHLATGSSILGQKLIDLTERLAGNSLLDTVLGSAALGFYTFSSQVSRFSLEAVANPVWAVIYVQSLRNDIDTVLRLHAQLCRLLGVLLFPVTLLVSAATPDLIALVLGPSWAPSAGIIRVLLPSYAVGTVLSQIGAVLTAIGRNDIVLRACILATGGRLLAVAGGLFFGLSGISYGVVIANALYGVFLQTKAARVLNHHPGAVALSLTGPVIAGASGAASYLGFVDMIGVSPLTVIGALFAAFCVSVGTFVAIDHKRIKADIAAIKGLKSRSLS